jgi:hypothetical protein
MPDTPLAQKELPPEVRSIINGYLDPRSVVKFSGVNKNYYQEITNDPSYAAALFKGMLDYIGHQDPALQVSVIREAKLPSFLLTFLPKSREKVFDVFRDAALNLTDEYDRALAIGKVAAGLGAIEPEMLLQCVVALKTGSKITQTQNTLRWGQTPL